MNRFSALSNPSHAHRWLLLGAALSAALLLAVYVDVLSSAVARGQQLRAEQRLSGSFAKVSSAQAALHEPKNQVLEREF